MQQKQVTVIVGPPGSGKSTLLPYRLMLAPDPLPPDLFTRNGQIIVTEPRIEAIRQIPRFIASVMHSGSVGAGFDIGFIHGSSLAADWRNKPAKLRLKPTSLTKRD
jgi:HrpA-like RNA helicase